MERPIGASANVVAVATYERMTDKKIGWGYYCKACYPAMMVVVIVCNSCSTFFTSRNSKGWLMRNIIHGEREGRSEIGWRQE